VSPLAQTLAAHVTAELSEGTVSTLDAAGVEVTVQAPQGVVPTGAVTIYAGEETVTASLEAGVATASLPRLAPGTYAVVAHYAGDAKVAGQVVLVGSLKVAKAVPEVSAKLKKAKIAASVKPVVQVTVDHEAVAATGKVVVLIVKDGETVSSKATSLSAKNAGKVSVRLPKVTKAGTYSVKVSYKGSTLLAAKAAKTLKLKVVR
jgi:hypothetical protein